MNEAAAPKEKEIEIAGLRVIAVGEEESARSIVILLHGFAMRPADLSPFAHSLGLPAWFLFPEGPLDAPLDSAPHGRAWWHIDPMLREAALAKGPRDFAEQHPPDLPRARALLSAVLDEVIRDHAAGRPIIMCGFSQGGMLTCDTLLRAPKQSEWHSAIKAVALLSASRIAFDEWAPFLARDTCNLHGMPILISHGELDADLAFSTGVALKDCLTEAGANVTWVPFDQGHEIPLVVWRRLRKLIESVTAK